MAKKLTEEQKIKALKFKIKKELRSLMYEQGGGPIPRYRMDAGGCIQCPPNVGPSVCPFTDPNCTTNSSGGASGGQTSYACINNACQLTPGWGPYADLQTCQDTGCGSGPQNKPMDTKHKMPQQGVSHGSQGGGGHGQSSENGSNYGGGHGHPGGGGKSRGKTRGRKYNEVKKIQQTAPHRTKQNNVDRAIRNRMQEGHCAEGMYMNNEGHCMPMNEGHCAEGMYMNNEGHCMPMETVKAAKPTKSIGNPTIKRRNPGTKGPVGKHYGAF